MSRPPPSPPPPSPAYTKGPSPRDFYSYATPSAAPLPPLSPGPHDDLWEAAAALVVSALLIFFLGPFVVELFRETAARWHEVLS